MLCAFKVFVAFWQRVLSGYKNIGGIFVMGTSKGTTECTAAGGTPHAPLQISRGTGRRCFLHETPGSMQQQTRFQRVTGGGDSTQRRLFINQTSGVYNSRP